MIPITAGKIIPDAPIALYAPYTPYTPVVWIARFFGRNTGPAFATARIGVQGK
ncbi:hypothetical protein ASZ90_000215 [hydrocarbon metagenome]|uniref:Uncharacterized protein n=1 Tax=hydrocarbon metagenome TaxID=938273 RepID=A0A0W8GA92_9ZZZZ